jgi:SAM-dependent methyltransferase
MTREVDTLLYSELASWYHLVDPLTDHLDEATAYADLIDGAVGGKADTLLELGSGAGHNAFYLKRRFRSTLTDISAPMLARNAALNPECEHLRGDMRTLRLNRTFDAVLLHDAVVYMTTEQDLLASMRTAFVHTRPGGAAIFAPDHLRETFRESTEAIQGEDGSRALRGVMWTWDPDPRDDTCTVDFAFLLRDGDDMKATHDRHVEGLFSEATWHRLLASAGFESRKVTLPAGNGVFEQIFVCRKP